MFDRLEWSLLLLCAVCLSSAIGEDVTANPEQTDVHLGCDIPSAKWKKDNNTIEASNKGYVLMPENGTLIIKKIDDETMGVYVCTDDKDSNTVTVFVPSYVKPFEKTKNIIQDDPLQLECKGYGYPIPVVEWYKGDELRATDGDRITLKDTPKHSGSSSVMTNGTIRIQKMAFEDAGDYVCVATNTYGTSNATITVQVKDKLAALWPFLGICAEVAILCAVIFIYERRRAKKMQEEEDRAQQAEEAERLTSNNETKVNDEVRQRK